MPHASRSALVIVSFVLVALPGALATAAGMKEMNPPPAPVTAETIALVGARLIDGRGGTPVEDSVVVVRGSKIAAAGDAAAVLGCGDKAGVSLGGVPIHTGRSPELDSDSV